MSRSFASSAVFMPEINTAPPLGKRMPFRVFAKVDLPEPLCPSIATKLPSSIFRLTPSIARFTSVTFASSSRVM